jgi:hypothetical protein
MTRKKSRREALLLAPVKAGVVLALALSAAVLTSLPGVPQPSTRVWKGYETLLIRADLARPEVLARVVRALGPGVASEITARVSFWDFTGIGDVTVAGMDARIDPSDPRHDRFMDGLPGYFRSPPDSASAAPRAARGFEWSIAYIPARRAAVMDYARLAAVLGLPLRGSWRLAEFDPIECIVSVAALLALAAMLASPFGRGGRARLLAAGSGALLWLPFLLPGGVARLALSLLLIAAWFPVVHTLLLLHGWDEKLLKEARNPLVRFLAAAGAGLVVLLPASSFSPSATIAYVGAVTASALLVVALALFWGRARRPRRRTRKFEPVPIVRPSAQPARAGPAYVLVACAGFLLVAVIGVLRSAPLPTPLPVFGARDFSWESLARLASVHRAPRLPDMSDFVAHEAFQETLSFGRQWGLPRPDEKVYVREFATNARSGTIVAGLRQVKVFDSEWLGSVLRLPTPGSIQGLLLAQGRAMAVASRGQARNLVRELPVALLVMFIFSAWFAWDWRAAPLMKSVLLRFNGAARRNQVP